MLTFNLKKEWFEKIKSGEKHMEYREKTPYWTKRIYGKSAADSKICFCCGYPPKEAEEKRLYGEIIAIYNYKDGLDTDLKTSKPVIGIKFRLIKN